MKKIFATTSLIFGTVVGSGFSSGREILVFFSRFGQISYMYIILSVFMFFLLFYFFLTNCQKIEKSLNKYKIINFIVFIVSIVFAASMFAGIENLVSYLSVIPKIVFMSIILLLCIYVAFKGVVGVSKINSVIVPIMSFIFLFILLSCLGDESGFCKSVNSWAGFLYSPLYVALNVSVSGIVFSKAGKLLNRKQAMLSSLFSCLVLLVFLVLGNFILLNNPDSFLSEMPFLFLFSKNKILFYLGYFVIFIGCFTTLLSLILTLKDSIMAVKISENHSSIFAVFFPFVLSSLGFSELISFFYPICSVLGIFVLCCFVFEVFKI